MIRDLEVLKQGNVNHVRTCHYSDDPRWYELCDEYGIYLNAEANCECHGYMFVLDREPKYEKAIVDRSVANVENFKNHASVIMWSPSNECSGGSINFVSALEGSQKERIDTSRPVHYEPFNIGANNPGRCGQSYVYGRRRNRADRHQRHLYQAVLSLRIRSRDVQFHGFGLRAITTMCSTSIRSAAMGEARFAECKRSGHLEPARSKTSVHRFRRRLWCGLSERSLFHPQGRGRFRIVSPKPHYPEMKRVYQWIGTHHGGRSGRWQDHDSEQICFHRSRWI